MEYYDKYLKYKLKYLKLKNEIANTDNYMIGAGKKKTTQSYIPFEKLTSRDKIYIITDNGGEPYKVVANTRGIQIYKEDYVDIKYITDDYESTYSEKIYEIKKFLGYWSGYDTTVYKMHGNSLLIKISKKKYISIESKICSFKTDEEILDFVAYMGENTVPYPVAFGNKYIYFMLECQKVPRKDFITELSIDNVFDIIREFHGHINTEKKHNKIPMKDVVIIQQRIYIHR